MVDGLWLSTISYEPSAINYRLYIKIAFIRCRVIKTTVIDRNAVFAYGLWLIVYGLLSTISHLLSTYIYVGLIICVVRRACLIFWDKKKQS